MPRPSAAAEASGFAPLVAAGARLLVLGSLPGVRSLRDGEYYAQPRNAFWPIMGELTGARPDLPYAERGARLVAAGVALWDVCGSARRAGSLDAAIEGSSVVATGLARALVAMAGGRAPRRGARRQGEVFSVDRRVRIWSAREIG